MKKLSKLAQKIREEMLVDETTHEALKIFEEIKRMRAYLKPEFAKMSDDELFAYIEKRVKELKGEGKVVPKRRR